MWSEVLAFDFCINFTIALAAIFVASLVAMGVGSINKHVGHTTASISTFLKRLFVTFVWLLAFAVMGIHDFLET